MAAGAQQQHEFERRPRQAGRLGEDERRVGRVVEHGGLRGFDRHPAHQGERDDGLLEPARLGGIVDDGFAQCAGALERLEPLAGGGIAARVGHRVGADLADHFADDGADFLGRAWVGGGELGPHRVRGARDQPQKMMARNVAAQAEPLGQNVVAGGMLHQHFEAVVREPRAGVARHRARDLRVAALDQHVGDRLAQVAPFGNREQVQLALRGGAFAQHGVVEPRRACQHRPRDLDFLVEGEGLDRVDGRVGDGGQQARELGPGGYLDLRGKPRDHVVEQGNLFVGITARAGDEQAGDVPEGSDAPFDRARRDRTLEVADQRSADIHRHPAPWEALRRL